MGKLSILRKLSLYKHRTRTSNEHSKLGVCMHSWARGIQAAQGNKPKLLFLPLENQSLTTIVPMFACSWNPPQTTEETMLQWLPEGHKASLPTKLKHVKTKIS